MTKIITVKYEARERKQMTFDDTPFLMWIAEGGGDTTSPNDLDKTFKEAMDCVAEKYSRYQGEPEYVIVDSSDISDICCSSQCFFPKDLKQALEKKGYADVDVEGIMGSSHVDCIIERIKKDRNYEDIEYLDGITHAANPVLYKISKR